MRDRVSILGVPVDASTTDGFLARIQSGLRGEGAGAIFAVNAEKIMRARKDPELLKVLESAALLLPDGFGPVVGMKLLHGRKVDRTTGVGLMQEILGLAAGGGIRVFILGARPGVAAAAYDNLKNRYPDLDLVGYEHGFLPPEEQERLISRINRLGTEVLFVGLGSPRQEHWIHTWLPRLKVKFCMGVGGSINVIAGEAALAPAWVSRLYLEWLYRLIQEPARFRRYRVIPVFIFRLLTEAVFRRKRRNE